MWELLHPAEVSNREPFAHKTNAQWEISIKVLVHAPTSGATYETEKLFSPPKFRRSPLGSEDLFARRRKEFWHSPVRTPEERIFSPDLSARRRKEFWHSRREKGFTHVSKTSLPFPAKQHFHSGASAPLKKKKTPSPAGVPQDRLRSEDLSERRRKGFSYYPICDAIRFMIISNATKFLPPSGTMISAFRLLGST